MSEEVTEDVQPKTVPKDASPWEREVIEKVLLASIREQRLTRRWGLALKFTFLAYLSVVLWLAVNPFSDKGPNVTKAHTAVVEISGLITESSKTNAESIIKGLKSAVENKWAKGVILKMNTPGGTPVQAAYVYQEIRSLKQSHPSLPIIAVVSDLCASGGYYIAAAADKIFVNPSSIVGSIGVIMNGFGFVQAIEKLGIERRAMTAGEHKALLDPFMPIDPAEKAQAQKILNGIHQQFIQAVREGRGSRLKEQPDLFSGLVWTGAEGIELGLADGIGDLQSVAEQEIAAPELVNYTAKEDLLERLTHRLGTAFSGILWGGDSYGVRLQ